MMFRSQLQGAARIGFAILGFAFVFMQMVARAQTNANSAIVFPPTSTEFAIEIKSADEGLPQNTATAVIQTRRGYVWVGTYGGIAQFDGLRFNNFDSSNTKGLANSRVTALFEDSRGVVWIGHDGGELTRYADGEFTALKHCDEWGKAPIKTFIEDERGEPWCLNQRGDAMRISDGRILKSTGLMAENLYVNPNADKDGRGRAYVARNGVVARFTSVGFAVVDFGDPSTNPYYDGIAAARDGNLWVLGEGKVRKWSGTNWVADVGVFPWVGLTVTTLRESSSGRLIMGTLQSGLFVFDPATGAWSHLNRTTGLPQDWVCSLAEDQENNLWVGTHGGLALLRERKVTMHSPPDQWQGRPVLSTMRAHDGAVWAATEGAGVYRFKDNVWTHFDVANPFVWSVYEDSQKQIWAGTWGGGLFRLENGQFAIQTNLFPTTDPVLALIESPVGTMWIGTGKGLMRVRGGVLEKLTAFGDAAAGDVRAIEVGDDGELWIGTQGSGLGHFKNGKLQTFWMTNGLAGNFIISLCHETNGTLWIGTLDMGLSRYKGGVFRTINTTHGFPGNTIFHIEDDQEGNLWFNSPHGLFRVSKAHLNACADGTLATLDLLTYGKAEGLTTLTGTGGFTPSGFRAPDGRLWFSTARGIAIIAPQSARPNPISPPVWIEDVLVDGAVVSAKRSAPARNTRGNAKDKSGNLVTLQPGRRQLDVQFTGLSYTSPERVRFKYRLRGIDSDWIEAGTRRRVTYPFLLPGEYTFHVAACNSDGLWNETGDTLDIVVLPFFWQTLWFKFLMVILAVMLIALVFYFDSRRRIRSKIERIARERELERERARIAQDIHDDLGASLTRIGLLSQTAVDDPEHPRRAVVNLELILSTTRDLTRSMDEIVWAVNPRHDTLESLTNYISSYAHDFLSTAHIRCRLALPLELPDISVRSEIRHNLFLAIKEALNNVVKHSKANEARLTLEFVPGGLRFVITDNGPGFDPHRLNANGKNPRVTGDGLPNLVSRLKQIGGHSKLSSTPGEGTTVEFFVPLADSSPARPRSSSE